MILLISLYFLITVVEVMGKFWYIKYVEGYMHNNLYNEKRKR